MQFVKGRSDELASLGKPLDPEDLIETILQGLDDDYHHLVEVVEGRDSPISFDELHEKLITRELSLKQAQHTSFSHLATANVAASRSFNNQHVSMLRYPPYNRSQGTTPQPSSAAPRTAQHSNFKSK